MHSSRSTEAAEVSPKGLRNGRDSQTHKASQAYCMLPDGGFSKISRRIYDDKMPGIIVDDCRHEALVLTGGESLSWSLIEQILAVRSAGATTWSLS